MTQQFKHLPYQSEAVAAVVDCFAGQPLRTGLSYLMDKGQIPLKPGQFALPSDPELGFRNAEVNLSREVLLANVQAVQKRQNLPPSSSLFTDEVCPLQLDIEMETGTGKTYCYIRTLFELHQQYGWSKFIIMVPSIAIREGVYYSFKSMAEHFLGLYGKRARFFIYDSKQLHQIEHFSSDAGINVMIMNVQAFNATGKDNRRIYEQLDDFQSRRPIDVIKANHPILILDEPQKMEGQATQKALPQFNPLMILRYSATHKTHHNKVYRLDALDAYNQKLVKKIAVRGITLKGQEGRDAYLYLDGIDVAPNQPPVARVELEVRSQQGGRIQRALRKLHAHDNLYQKFGQLEAYHGYTVTHIDAHAGTIAFSNGVVLRRGQAQGDVTESTLRRVQIREAIKAHFAKEATLFAQGIKVLSLFFIDEVAKYRQYDETGAQSGEYAYYFEEEYTAQLQAVLATASPAYRAYLESFAVTQIHNGYFSVDKRSRRLVDPALKRGSTDTDDTDAYDLILKDKERLLSLKEPVRFIFSHSALREGWDNPNVFVICTLKQSDNNVSRRQEVGRGLRLAVNQRWDRMDDPATVHDINVLTVVVSESYEDFVTALQQDLNAAIDRPRVADEAYFTGKVLATETGPVTVTPQMAKQLYRYLCKHEYTNDQDQITEAYHTARASDGLAPLPPELSAYTPHIVQLIDSVFSPSQLPKIANELQLKRNRLNDNFHRREFQDLWQKIHHRAVYAVKFDSAELVTKCITALNQELQVKALSYVVQTGIQRAQLQQAQIAQGQAFATPASGPQQVLTDVPSQVSYDLLGKLAQTTQLTRRTVAHILQGLAADKFAQYVHNPEDFLRQAGRIIQEQTATMIVDYITYNRLDKTYTLDIFTQAKQEVDPEQAFQAQRHIFDYVLTDSATERKFAEHLENALEVVVYAKLPKMFAIPTPVGNYNPDWAIAFTVGQVKHVYFVAETKGALSSLELRQIEKAKIDCARKFFAAITAEQVRYDVVHSYDQLRDLVS